MKQYLYKISLFLGFLALGTPHLQATKVVFHYEEKDNFNTLRLLEKPTLDQVKNYTEKPDVHEKDLAKTPEHRLFNTALNFLVPVEGSDTPSPTFFQEIYGAALKLSEAAEREKPHTVVFLGRAPTFLKETLQQLYALEPKEGRPSLVQVAFSGCPDIKTVNAGLQAFSYLRNVLTPGRLKVFFQLLDSLGFDKITREMWLVDTLASGAGLNSFLRLLKGYYLEKKMPFPDFRFWGLSLAECDGRAAHDTFYFDYAKRMLSFSDQFSHLGYKAMDIPCAPLPLHDRVHQLMDQDMVEHFYAGVQEYNAWKMVDPNPVPPQTPGADLTLFRDRVLIPVINALHAKGDQALVPITLEERYIFMVNLLKWIPLEDMVQPEAKETILPDFIHQHCAGLSGEAKESVLQTIKTKIMTSTYLAKEETLEGSSRVYSPQSAVQKP